MSAEKRAHQLHFIYSSLADIQSTIRVIDAKIAIIIGVLALPFANLGKIYANLDSLYRTVDFGPGQWSYWLLLFLFCASWLLAFVAAIRAIMGINNPALHVKLNNKPSGNFYGSGLYDTGFADVFITRKIKSKQSLESYIQTFPDDFDNIRSELVFEHMKLVYIREIKSIRLRWTYLMTIAWLSAGFFVRVIHLYCCDK